MIEQMIKLKHSLKRKQQQSQQEERAQAKVKSQQRLMNKINGLQHTLGRSDYLV